MCKYFLGAIRTVFDAIVWIISEKKQLSLSGILALIFLKDQKEIDLVEKLAKGDALAFAEMVNVYRDRLQYFSLHYLGQEEIARDVVQDVFSDVWEGRSKIEEVKNLSSWLFSIAKNKCLKRIEHLKVQQKHANFLKYRQLQANHDALSQLDTSPMIFDEINEIIEINLAKLPAQTRRIFELSRFEKKKNREIAEELNLSIKTVEAGITKSLKILRPALQQYLPLIFF